MSCHRLALALTIGSAVLSAAPIPARADAPAVDRFRKPDELIAALGLKSGQRVADVGAGGGYLTLRLARAVGPHGHVVATDVDDAALRTLATRARASALNHVIETRKVAADVPGLEKAAYDLILLAEVDHLLADRVAFFRALATALKPGGVLAVSNTQRHEEAVRLAAATAELSLRGGNVDLPGQFLVLLRKK